MMWEHQPTDGESAEDAYKRGYATAVADVVQWLRLKPYRGLLLENPIKKAADDLQSGAWKAKAKP